MRRLAQRDDRGVTTIMVVLLMPTLLFFGAFVFDGGRGVLARRQTQNAADAGALAKATDCAKNVAVTNFAPYQTDGATLANTPTCGSGSTTVSMKRTITALFSPDGGSADVTRSATARWGTIGAATTLPLTIATCEFQPSMLDSTGSITLLLDNPQPSTGCSSPAGGFSQLASSGCGVAVTAAGTVAGKPGNDLGGLISCITLGQNILIPMYDSAACQATDCKGRGPYTITGFAEFNLTGYWFTNNNHSGGTLLNAGCPTPTAGTGTGTQSCIRGSFVRFVTSQGTPGPSTDYGTSQVFLSS